MTWIVAKRAYYWDLEEFEDEEEARARFAEWRDYPAEEVYLFLVLDHVVDDA